MTVVTAGPAKWTWSEDVLAFARQAGVEAYLDPILEATQELFPRAREIRISVWQDPEVANLRAIAWDVCVPDSLDLSEYKALKSAWIQAFTRLCPTTHLHRFVRSIRSVTP